MHRGEDFKFYKRKQSSERQLKSHRIGLTLHALKRGAPFINLRLLDSVGKVHSLSLVLAINCEKHILRPIEKRWKLDSQKSINRNPSSLFVKSFPLPKRGLQRALSLFKQNFQNLKKFPHFDLSLFLSVSPSLPPPITGYFKGDQDRQESEFRCQSPFVCSKI